MLFSHSQSLSRRRWSRSRGRRRRRGRRGSWRADDKDNAVPGSKPILVGSGQASVDVEVEKVTFDLVVNISPDDYDEADEAMGVALRRCAAGV